MLAACDCIKEKESGEGKTRVRGGTLAKTGEGKDEYYR